MQRQPAAPAPGRRSPGPPRRRARAAAAAAARRGAGDRRWLVGLYWYAMSGRYVSTENAYVKADIVAISPDIDGRVIAVEVAENQLVRQGDVLFRIDPEPFQIALDMAEAKIAHGAPRHRGAARRVPPDRGRDRRGAGAGAVLRAAGEAAARARGRGIATQVDARGSRAGPRRGAPADARRCARSCVPCSPSLGGDPGERGRAAPDLPRGRGRARHGRTRSRPHRGHARRSTASSAGCACSRANGSRRATPAFSIIDPASHLDRGQPQGDPARARRGRAAGRDRGRRLSGLSCWQGEVASISPATGAEFALIPPQNATGNWVKVVQRLPVRIAVEAGDGQPPLRAGMTVTVAIDTEREPRLASSCAGRSRRTRRTVSAAAAGAPADRACSAR